MATTIVRAKPPSKVHRAPCSNPAPRAAPLPVHAAREPAAADGDALSRAAAPLVANHLAPGPALRAYRELLAGWNLREDRGWMLLTGHPAAPQALTEAQAQRVTLLVELDAAVGSMMGNVGAWLVEPNPGPLLSGGSPLEFLTRMGLPGDVALLRQARRWAAM